MRGTLLTKWGKELDPEHVLEEYPRPQLRRESFLNLNGYWEYAFTTSPELPERYAGRILVPFSPEAPLSGVNRQLQPDEYLHYRRQVEMPDRKDGIRWILHFGAVDQSCRVCVNGVCAGRHTGGYLPFSLDVTDLLWAGENVLRVVVRDLSDTSWHAKGKQSLERGGMWYTAQSGIWQTVWMEQVPEHYIRNVRLTPDYDDGSIRIRVFTNHPERKSSVRAAIRLRGGEIGVWNFRADKTCRIPLANFCAWTPENPILYDISLQMGDDAVSSYFGMRKFSVGRDRRGILRFFLNNEPYYHNGLLDQGYYPDGLYTAPSDEAMRSDIRVMKALGFNMLRKHIKIEPDRWYYHCDTMGMLVWQDMVCGGDRYRPWFVTYLPNILMWTGRVIRDRHYWLFSRRSAEGRAEFLRELRETIRLLHNHPGIAAWVPFNEGWGQYDAKKVTALVRREDPRRLIDEASGWFDQGGGDMYSIHNYWRRLRIRPQKNRVAALTECGGYSLPDPEHSYDGAVYGYRTYSSKEELTEGIRGLWEKELIPNVSRGLGASVYTQLSDVEDEVNGLLTYDRERIKVDPDKMREMNRELAERFSALV